MDQNRAVLLRWVHVDSVHRDHRAEIKIVILLSYGLVYLELWYIIVDVCNILLSIIVFLLYWKKNMEEKKMELFYSQSLIGK